MYEFTVKILTPECDSLIPISLHLTLFRRFEDIFCWFLHLICGISIILLLPVYLTYWLRKCIVGLCFVPHAENFHQVLRWYDRPLPSYSVLAADTLRDLVTLSFHFSTLVSDQWSYRAGHTVNPSTKFEVPTAICSWVMSSDTSTLNMTLTT